MCKKKPLLRSKKCKCEHNSLTLRHKITVEDWYAIKINDLENNLWRLLTKTNSEINLISDLDNL